MWDKAVVCPPDALVRYTPLATGVGDFSTGTMGIFCTGADTSVCPDKSQPFPWIRREDSVVMTSSSPLSASPRNDVSNPASPRVPASNVLGSGTTKADSAALVSSSDPTVEDHAEPDLPKTHAVM